MMLISSAVFQFGGSAGVTSHISQCEKKKKKKKKISLHVPFWLVYLWKSRLSSDQKLAATKFQSGSADK